MTEITKIQQKAWYGRDMTRKDGKHQPKDIAHDPKIFKTNTAKQA